MGSHLVTVKVRIVSGTYERMKLDRFTLDQDRLKCLDAEAVQCRSTVEHHRMLLDHIL